MYRSRGNRPALCTTSGSPGAAGRAGRAVLGGMPPGAPGVPSGEGTGGGCPIMVVTEAILASAGSSRGRARGQPPV